MPEVPQANGFVDDGLNTRPTFFGCNDTTTPVIIYIPNNPYSYASHTSTYTSSYSMDQANGLLENGRLTVDLNGAARLADLLDLRAY